MQPHDWLWLLPVAASAYNAWQNKSIQNAILSLKIELSGEQVASNKELSERIGRNEADIRELRVLIGSSRANFNR